MWGSWLPAIVYHLRKGAFWGIVFKHKHDPFRRSQRWLSFLLCLFVTVSHETPRDPDALAALVAFQNKKGLGGLIAGLMSFMIQPYK